VRIILLRHEKVVSEYSSSYLNRSKKTVYTFVKKAIGGTTIAVTILKRSAISHILTLSSHVSLHDSVAMKAIDPTTMIVLRRRTLTLLATDADIASTSAVKRDMISPVWA
jgi:hypothetical protein